MVKLYILLLLKRVVGISLWVKLSEFTLHEDVEDEITWNLTNNDQYSSTSAYRAQLFGATSSPIASSVWKFWTPPKYKFLMWLALQSRFWTNDRLEKMGYPNCWDCPLCKRALESVDHLLVNYRYTIRLWGLLNDWLGIQSLDLNLWPASTLHPRWGKMTKLAQGHRFFNLPCAMAALERKKRSGFQKQACATLGAFP
jgi:hypothetical protein